MVEYRQSSVGLGYAVVYRKPLSVGKVARICSVCNKTVLNWIYHNALKYYRTVGGQYRVWPGDLKQFLEVKAIDVPFQYVEERETTFLLMVNDRYRGLILRKAICRRYKDANVISANDLYESLLIIGERRPQVLILDVSLPQAECLHLLEVLKSRKERNQMKVVLFSTIDEEDSRSDLESDVVDEFWEKSKSLDHHLSTSPLFSPPAVTRHPYWKSSPILKILKAPIRGNPAIAWAQKGDGNSISTPLASRTGRSSSSSSRPLHQQYEESRHDTEQE